MRFYITSKSTPKCLKLKGELIDILMENGFEIDEDNPEIVFSLGGDGTFLRTIHSYGNVNPLFIGFNEGKLGFLCEFTLDNFKDVIEKLINQNYLEKEVRLLRCRFSDKSFYALNEIRIEAINGNSLNFNVSINDDYLEKPNADGICFATSLGSSGITRGLRGALVSSNLEIIEMCEKTPINNRIYSSLNSPLILDKDSVILLDDFSSSTFNIFYDNYYYLVNNFNGEIEITLSNKTIRILKNEETSYINRLNDSFIREN